MNISIDNKAGKTLYTQGKYCAENIVVTPVLEEISVTPTTAEQTKEPSTGKAGISKVTVAKIPDEYVIPQGSLTITENGTVDVSGLASVTVSVPSEKQQLSAPTIELSGANIEITDKNGLWADSWKISNGTDTYISTDTVQNLSTIFQSAEVGQYSITAIASNSENKMSDSAASNSVSWSVYSVSYTLSNCTATTKPTKAYQGADTTIILSANTNYALPDSVSVLGATVKSYSKSTGNLVLTNATGAITVSCTAVQSVFTITANLSNCTADSTNATTISAGGTETLVFTANSGYALPSTVTVSGATYTWEQSTGMLDLSNPTANVTITITATEVASSETWLLNKNIDIQTGAIISGTFGKAHKLNVGNFTCNQSTYICFAFDWDGNISSTGSPAFGISATDSDNSYTETYIYDLSTEEGEWVNEAYRTITFETAPTGDLLTWLQSNGTKQGTATLISFTIDGTSYQAEEGMTWAQWVDSSYNTGRFVNADTYIADRFGTAVATAGGGVVPPSYTIQSGTDYILGGGTAN